MKKCFSLFNQQEPNVKVALVLGISAIIAISSYALITSTLKKTDMTRCLETYQQNHNKFFSYEKCSKLLKR